MFTKSSCLNNISSQAIVNEVNLQKLFSKKVVLSDVTDFRIDGLVSKQSSCIWRDVHKFDKTKMRSKRFTT